MLPELPDQFHHLQSLVHPFSSAPTSHPQHSRARQQLPFSLAPASQQPHPQRSRATSQQLHPQRSRATWQQLHPQHSLATWQQLPHPQHSRATWQQLPQHSLATVPQQRIGLKVYCDMSMKFDKTLLGQKAAAAAAPTTQQGNTVQQLAPPQTGSPQDAQLAPC